MFGRSDKNDEKAEAEARRLEAMKTSIEAALAHMKSHAEAGNTDRCEAAAKRLVETLKNPKLPGDYSKQARGVLDSLLLHGFMKATAVAAKGALDAAKSDDAELRGRLRNPDQLRRTPVAHHALKGASTAEALIATG